MGYFLPLDKFMEKYLSLKNYGYYSYIVFEWDDYIYNSKGKVIRAITGVFSMYSQNPNEKQQAGKRRPWTKQDDEALVYLREAKKLKRWTDIAEQMELVHKIKGRTEKQCRDRYENYLKNKLLSDSVSEWNHQDDERLLQVYCQMGNKWSEIAKHFPNMNGSSVKNKFYSRMRKALRTINMIIQYHFCDQYQKVSLEVIFRLVTSVPEQTSSHNHSEKGKVSRAERERYLSVIRGLMEVTLHSENNYRTKFKIKNSLGSNDEHRIRGIIQFLLQLDDKQKSNSSSIFGGYTTKKLAEEKEEIYKSSSSDKSSADQPGKIVFPAQERNKHPQSQHRDILPIKPYRISIFCSINPKYSDDYVQLLQSQSQPTQSWSLSQPRASYRELPPNDGLHNVHVLKKSIFRREKKKDKDQEYKPKISIMSLKAPRAKIQEGSFNDEESGYSQVQKVLYNQQQEKEIRELKMPSKQVLYEYSEELEVTPKE